jgi:hypothetical protein
MIPRETRTIGECSWRTSSLRGGYCHSSEKDRGTWELSPIFRDGGEGIELRKGGDFGGRGGSGEMVLV